MQRPDIGFFPNEKLSITYIFDRIQEIIFQLRGEDATAAENILYELRHLGLINENRIEFYSDEPCCAEHAYERQQILDDNESPDLFSGVQDVKVQDLKIRGTCP